MMLTVIILIVGFIIYAIQINCDSSERTILNTSKGLAAEQARKLVMDPSMNLIDGNIHE